MLNQRQPKGMLRCMIPHRPTKATMSVATMNTGSVACANPPARSEDRNGVQLVVPRSTSMRFNQRVVRPEDSMKSVNGGE